MYVYSIDRTKKVYYFSNLNLKLRSLTVPRPKKVIPSSVPQIQMIDIDKLEFDKENLRIPSSWKGTIIDWMVKKEAVIPLMETISYGGFDLNKPLIVFSDKNKIIVKEGNRRLAVTRLLNNPNLTTIQTQTKKIAKIVKDSPNPIPKKLPVIFSEKEHIETQLGQDHVTGKRPWRCLPKAKHLNLLYSKSNLEEEKKFDAIAKRVGAKKDSVIFLLMGYWLYEILEKENFFDIPNLSEESIKFSHLYDLIKRTENQKFLNINLTKKSLKNIDKKHFKELCTWFYGRKKGKRLVSRDVTKIKDLVSTPSALAFFRKGFSLRESLKFSNYNKEKLKIDLENCSKTLRECTELSANIENLTSKVTRNIGELLENISSSIDKISQDIL